MTEPTNLGTQHSRAVIDNGALGTREIIFSTGRLARQAAGSALAQLGDTVVLSATTASKQPRDQLDFFPLTVDVEERMYAAGRIPGSFFRREGRPSEDAILTCRLIDRPLRPSLGRSAPCGSRSSRANGSRFQRTPSLTAPRSTWWSRAEQPATVTPTAGPRATSQS